MGNKDFDSKQAMLDQMINNAQEYMQTPQYQKDMKQIHRKVKKQKRKKIYLWIKSNVWNIISLLIGITTLVFAVLTYTKA